MEVVRRQEGQRFYKQLGETVREVQALRPEGLKTSVEVARRLTAVSGDGSTTLWLDVDLKTGELLWGDDRAQISLGRTATAEELELARQAMGML